MVGKKYKPLIAKANYPVGLPFISRFTLLHASLFKFNGTVIYSKIRIKDNIYVFNNDYICTATMSFYYDDSSSLPRLAKYYNPKQISKY